MPREQIIRAESHERPAVESSEEYPASDAHTETKLGLSVGWHKAGWLQLYMETPGEDGIAYVVDLNRYETNLLIRRLRTARDQAFGRDE